jgi:hypothetical protein
VNNYEGEGLMRNKIKEALENFDNSLKFTGLDSLGTSEYDKVIRHRNEYQTTKSGNIKTGEVLRHLFNDKLQEEYPVNLRYCE